MIRSDFGTKEKSELITIILKLSDSKNYFVEQKEKADIVINELLEKVDRLEKENEALRKSAQKRSSPGRPSLNDETIRNIKKLRSSGFTVREIARKLNLSLGVVSKYNPDYQKQKY